MKKIILFTLVFITFCLNVFAAEVAEQPIVAVMDFGTHKGALTSDIKLVHAEKASCDYIIDRLLESNHFIVMDKEMIARQLQNENLNTVGLIDSDTAKRIGELLHVRYLIYGNVNDVSLSDTGAKIDASIGGGVAVSTVKSHIIARMMDVTTGDIVMAAKGEGKSKSTFVKVKSQPVGTIMIGTYKVTQDSVHNAIQKAAYATVDLLVERLYGKGKK